MVEYSTWTSAVHAAYRDLGGTYDEESDAQDLMALAGRWWSEYDRISSMSEQDAQEAAESLLRETL